jgi:hypothetical protein
MHGYLYASGNPVVLKDPSGRIDFGDIGDAIGGAAGTIGDAAGDAAGVVGDAAGFVRDLVPDGACAADLALGIVGIGEGDSLADLDTWASAFNLLSVYALAAAVLVAVVEPPSALPLLAVSIALANIGTALTCLSDLASHALSWDCGVGIAFGALNMPQMKLGFKALAEFVEGGPSARAILRSSGLETAIKSCKTFAECY